MKKVRISLADDHRILLAGLRQLLESEFDVVSAVENGKDLLEETERLNPDIVITDISMPIMNGLEVLRRVREAGLRTKFVFLTMHSDVQFVAEAFESGASAYVLKQEAVDELAHALREVLRGRIYISQIIAKGKLESVNCAGRMLPDSPDGQLTNRERQVLQLVAEGKILKEIAGVLEISISTAGFHKYNVMDKLNLRSTAALTQYAVRHRFVCVDA